VRDERRHARHGRRQREDARPVVADLGRADGSGVAAVARSVVLRLELLRRRRTRTRGERECDRERR
jgi:hypothetical protein